MSRAMEALRSLSKSELIQVVEKLSSAVGDGKVAQVVAGLAESGAKVAGCANSPPAKKARFLKTKKAPKPFEMSKYSQRHIALQVGYFGEKYFGLAAQEHLDETVEHHLFQALKKTRLVVDRASSRYSRCGRTDKGVSALSQVVSITVRSLKPLPGGVSKGEGKKVNEGKEWSDDDELCYPSILNRALPDDIFVLGWAPVQSDFDARFMAKSRSYRYFFSKRNMDLAKMKVAGHYLIGEHDFRNFCKMDVTNVRNFVRCVDSCKIEQLSPSSDICFAEISGNAFLWHQIRCIMGCELEEPRVVKELLDIASNPRKPVYLMAGELPLVLFESSYENVQFRYKQQVLQRLQTKLEQRLQDYTIKVALTSAALDRYNFLLSTLGPLPPSRKCDYAQACRASWGKSGMYQRLLERKTCSSYEERITNLSSNKRKAAKKRHGWDL